MVEKTVKICDECKKQLAAHTCAICGAKDICQRCCNRLGLNMVLDTSKYFFERTKTPLCKACCENLDRLEVIDKNLVMDQGGDTIIKALKKMFILKGLEDRAEKKK